MRQHGRESMGLPDRISIVYYCAHFNTVHTVCLSLCVDALLADYLQLLRGHSVDQPIFLVDRLRGDRLEGGCGHREERKERESRRDAGSFIDDDGGALPAGASMPGASFIGWVLRRWPPVHVKQTMKVSRVA